MDAASILLPIVGRLLEEALSVAQNKEDEAIAYLRGILGTSEEDRISITLAVAKAKAIKELNE